MSPKLNWLIFNINNTTNSTLSQNIITANISGYTIAIVAIYSVDIAIASHML